MYNENKQRIGTWEYSPYGEPFNFAGPPDVTQLYTGHTWDPAARLYYAPYRVYHPQTSRWLSREPLGFFDGVNMYAYVGGDPINFVDPNGLFAIQVGGMKIGWGDVNYDFDGADWDGYWGDVGDTLIGELKGAGSELSFGLYQPCYTSDLQRQGGNVGIGLAMAGEILGGWGAAGKAVKWGGREFSHAIPANKIWGGRNGLLDRFGRATKLNGNYVPIRAHALSDPARYRFMPAGWKKANPLWGSASRYLYRIPRFPLGLTAAAGGGYASS